MLSCDNKSIAKIGATGCPLVLCPKTKYGQVVEDVDILAADHDTVVKSKLVPIIEFGIDISNNPNLGSFYKGDVHVGVKVSEILTTSAIRILMEIG